MKTRLEPKKLKDIFDAGTISGLIDPLGMKIGKDGLSMINIYGGSLATNHSFDPLYFIKFESDAKDEEVVVLPSFASDKLKVGFEDDEMDFITDDGSFYFVGRRTSYDYELDSSELKKVPDYIGKLSPIKDKTKKNTVGYLPLSNKSKFDPVVILTLDSSELKLPTAKDFTFTMKDRVLEISNSEQGNLKFRPKIDGYILNKDISCAVSGDFIRSVVSCVNGKILLAIDPSGSLNLAISEIGKGYRKLFCIAGIESSEEKMEEDNSEDTENTEEEK